MKMVVVAVFDNAVGAFMRPFVAPSRGVAQRSFSDEVNRAGSEMHAHPEDYALHDLGVWDDATGLFISPVSFPEVIVRGKDVTRV